MIKNFRNGVIWESACDAIVIPLSKTINDQISSFFSIYDSGLFYAYPA